MSERIGFLGLGAMGGPMAANICRSGTPMTVFDKAGTAERAPEGATVAASLKEVAASCDTIFLSLPDAAASLDAVRAIAATAGARLRTVVDLSTIGIDAAREANTVLATHGIAYVDAPVSGGRAGAVNGTVTLIWSGPKGDLERLRLVLESFTGNVFHVGPRPGQGQAMKLLNNFLSATAMAATAEAVHFGLAHGLEMATMLDVLNVSTGRNTATSDKFPKRILTGTYDAGFRMALMQKDVALYLAETKAAATPATLAAIVATLWDKGRLAFPEGDFTEIFKAIAEAEADR